MFLSTKLASWCCLGKTLYHLIKMHWRTAVAKLVLESSWNVMAHGDVREGKWRGNWRMEWVATTLHPTSERGVSSITTADAHTSAGSSRLNWRLCRFKWTRPFRRKTKSGFCACAITFQTQSTTACSSTDLKTSRREYRIDFMVSERGKEAPVVPSGLNISDFKE
jgi:hypothetical protein